MTDGYLGPEHIILLMVAGLMIFMIGYSGIGMTGQVCEMEQSGEIVTEDGETKTVYEEECDAQFIEADITYQLLTAIGSVIVLTPIFGIWAMEIRDRL